MVIIDNSNSNIYTQVFLGQYINIDKDNDLLPGNLHDMFSDCQFDAGELIRVLTVLVKHVTLLFVETN